MYEQTDVSFLQTGLDRCLFTRNFARGTANYSLLLGQVYDRVGLFYVTHMVASEYTFWDGK